MAVVADPRTIEQLRTDLTDKLGELHRRATHTKALLTPATYWQSPWLRAGLGITAGLVIGTQLRRVTAGDVVRAVVFAGLGAIVAAHLVAGRDRDH